MKRKLFAILFLILFATTCLAQYPHFRSKPPLGTTIDWSHPQVQGLVGWWLMQEGMGDKVYDLSGNGNTGTLNGFAFPATAASGWNPGRIGRALKYDGGNDYVDCGNKSVLDIISSITLMTWIKKANALNGQEGLIAKYGATSGVQSYLLRFESDDDIQFLYRGLSVSNVIAANSVTDTLWHHVAGVYDTTRLYIYINGKLFNSVASTGSANSNSENVLIGGYTIPTLMFAGLMDDVRIYNRALTEREVLDVYTDGMSMFTPSFWLRLPVSSAQVVFFQ